LVYLLARNWGGDGAIAAVLEIDRVSEKMEEWSRSWRMSWRCAVGQQIQEKAKEEIEKSQREYLPRQQMEAIREELGEGDDSVRDAEEYRKKIEGGRHDRGGQDEARVSSKAWEMMTNAGCRVSGVIRTIWTGSSRCPGRLRRTIGWIFPMLACSGEDHYDTRIIKERIWSSWPCASCVGSGKEAGEPSRWITVRFSRGARTRDWEPSGFHRAAGVGKTSWGSPLLGRWIVFHPDEPGGYDDEQ
jgi:hypothetical protein